VVGVADGLDILVILPPQLGYNHPVMPIWSIKLFYSEAIELLKRRREIWILVILVVIFAGGSSSGLRSFGNSLSSSDSSKSKTEQHDSKLPAGSDKTIDYGSSLDQDKDFKKIQAEKENVSKKSQPHASTPEGAAVAAELAEFTDQSAHFLDLLQQVGWGWYAILGVNMFALLIWSLLFSFITAAWVKASLTWAVYRESYLKPWRLAEAIKTGFTYVGSFIWLRLVPTFGAVVVLGLGTLGVGLMIALLAVISKTSPWAVIAMVALGTAYLLTLLYSLFKLTVINEIAQRLVVAQALPAYDAFKLAFQWSKGMSRKFFRLAATEAILQIGVVIAALVPMIIVAVVMAGMFDNADAMFSSAGSSVMGVGVIVTAILFTLTLVLLFIVMFGLSIAAPGLHTALWQMAWNYLASVKSPAVKVQKA
jgi:hypothetical protein